MTLFPIKRVQSWQNDDIPWVEENDSMGEGPF